MTSEYNKAFKPGDRLILELKSQDIYEGLYADGGKNRIVLTDVIQHNNKNKLGGLYEFYRSEIDKIHTLKLPPTRNTDDPNKVTKSDPKDCKVIRICEEDYFRLKEMSTSYIYIENVDSRYFEAVKILSDSETVGVVSLGMENHRSGSFVRLLVLCTWKQVYIFDLINCEKRQLYPELKEIFESDYICKVIHKSAGLVDVFYRQYNIYVQNTFDTHVVDLILQKKETGRCLPVERDLSECLVHYLNFPASLLEHALNVPSKNWNERPLSAKTKLYASQLATYLILLKEHFQRRLLSDVYDAITKVQDYVYDLDDFQFLNYVSKKDVPKDIQSIIPNLKELSVKSDNN